MKGVNFITNSSNKKIAVQIDLKLLEKKEDNIEDFIDGVIAESRKNEKRISLDKVVAKLKLNGKL